ncbi:MAG: 50S ribosomal protein L4 [Candidatus Tectomicrobia bacterium]|uniref:Large ribosomal subunit protein uL4 n=1 Tax=Tectimicrobiota bacterium TaxID=2528274 RepID=A0A932GMB8_UNCTE|nr:50S ribosomal protein L4 [Candidatus Tectomicrobia bacterium]
MTLDVVDCHKKVVDTVDLKDEIFNVKIRDHLLHDVVVMQLNNRRRGTVATKNRSAVRGSNNKPWKQKGTGRARAGTLKSPLWVGGGVIFGPLPRDYHYQVPKKVRSEALRVALTLKVQNKQFDVVDQISLESPKTKEALALLKHLEAGDSVLFVVAEENRNLDLAVRNLPQVDVLPSGGLNVYDILSHDRVICTRDSLGKIEQGLTP